MKRLIFAAVAAFALGALTPAGAYNDGLERSTPEAQGVSSRAVAEFFAAVDEAGYDVHNIIIMRHDKVIAEHSWHPWTPEHKHAMYSATKTYTAAAIGFAVQEGLLNVSDRVMDIFPDLVPEQHAPELERLTVKHLLSMTAGHRSTVYPGAGDDQVRQFLSMDYAHEPGTTFYYNITCSHMLSHIISRLTGENIYDFLRPRLFDKIGISGDVVWEMDLSGRQMGNGGMHSRVSDMAKFGTFLKNGGRWNGEQILAQEWIDEMTDIYIYQNPQRSAEENAGDDGSQGYGYQTWRGRHGSFRAIGANCQLVLVIPESDVVVAAQCSLSDENGFNSLIYKLCDTMSDRKLKPEKGFSLEDAIAGYRIASPLPPSDPSAVVRTLARRYQMHQNQYGIKAVDVRFDAAGDFYLTFEGDAFTTNIPFALDDWKVGSTDRKAAFSRAVYTNMMGVTPYDVAGTCSWSAPGELTAYYFSMFNTGVSETFKLSFSETSLTLTIVAPEGRGGVRQQDFVLTGTL